MCALPDMENQALLIFLDLSVTLLLTLRSHTVTATASLLSACPASGPGLPCSRPAERSCLSRLSRWSDPAAVCRDVIGLKSKLSLEVSDPEFF